MTDRVSPSSGHTGDPVEMAFAVDAASEFNGYVVPSSSTTELAINDANITESNLNAFAESHSSSSFDVTIDAGEGFIGGAWTVRDVSTTVNLSSSTNGQIVYVGWDLSDGDSTLIGTDSTFGTYDLRIPIWEFDTDSNGVTTVRDKRLIGSANRYTDVFEWGAANEHLQDGNAQVAGLREIENGERVEIVEAVLVDQDGDGAVSTGASLLLAENPPSQTAAVTTVLSADGSTEYLDENPSNNSGLPAVYENNTGGVVTVGVFLDNGHFNNGDGGTGADSAIYGYVKGRIT